MKLPEEVEIIADGVKAAVNACPTVSEMSRIVAMHAADNNNFRNHFIAQIWSSITQPRGFATEDGKRRLKSLDDWLHQWEASPILVLFDWATVRNVHTNHPIARILRELKSNNHSQIEREICDNVFEQLDLADLLRCRRVCRAFVCLAADTKTWRDRCQEAHGMQAQPASEKRTSSLPQPLEPLHPPSLKRKASTDNPASETTRAKQKRHDDNPMGSEATNMGSSRLNDDHIFARDPDELKGDIMLDLAERHGNSKIFRTINKLHPNKPLKLVDNVTHRIRNALIRRASQQGTSVDEQWAQLDEVRRGNGIKVRGKEHRQSAVPLRYRKPATSADSP